MAMKQGPIERWSGWLLRKLMLAIAIMGLFAFVVAVLAAANANLTFAAGQVVWGLILMAPYAFIRYRDNETTTIPYVGA